MNQAEYVELGLACANVCTTLDRAMDGRRLDNLSQSVREAVGELTTLVKPKRIIVQLIRCFGTQHCGGYPTEDRQTGQTERSLSTSPRE